MKNKGVKIVIAVSVIIIFLLAYAQSQKKKPVDWTPTFYNIETNPYGTYITYNLLKDVFTGSIKSTRQPIYTNVKPDLDGYINYYEYDEYNEEEKIDMSFYDSIEETTDTTSYIFINQDFKIDNVDLAYFLDYIAIGNNVFISAENIAPLLLDTLKIKTQTKYFHLDSTYRLIDYDKKKYNIKNIAGYTKLQLNDCKLPMRPLAKNNLGDTVFIQIQYGKGNLFIHTVPSAFTNINMLNKGKYDFGFRSLSYLPSSNNILWDEYQKQGLIGEDSLFRVMLNSVPLRMALYIIVFGLLLYMIFGAKRIQRIIPIIKPPVNSSIEFLDTVSNLFYRKRDYKSIAHYRQSYFLDYIRKNYYMSTENINDEFISILQAKSGMTREKIKRIFSLYDDIMLYLHITNNTFLEYNNLLEEFYSNMKNK